MGLTFNAIDVETANADRASICQIGIVQVVDGQVSDTWETLVDPEEPFDFWNVRVHGIDERHVQGSPTMPQIRNELRRRLRGSFLVSHTGFDRVAFERAMTKYRLEQLQVTWLDSAMIAKSAWPDNGRWNLKALASKLGVSFQHHDALEDAKVVAEIVLQASQQTGRHVEDWTSVWSSSRKSRKPKSTSIKRASTNADGPLAGHRVVFTGQLSMARAQAADMAAEAGMFVSENVGRSTTIIVVGMQDRGLQDLYGKSGKHKKAEGLIEKGFEIEILSEADFLELLRQ